MSIDLIVTDMRMPQMDGYNLLKKVKVNYHPSTIRTYIKWIYR